MVLRHIAEHRADTDMCCFADGEPWPCPTYERERAKADAEQKRPKRGRPRKRKDGTT